MQIFVYTPALAKPLVWLGTARRDVRAFPVEVRQVAGFQLWRVQRGLEPNDWKPLPAVGVGVREIRVRTGREHRIVYLVQRAEAVDVLHAFEKRARLTSKRDLEVARQRLRMLPAERRAKRE